MSPGRVRCCVTDRVGCVRVVLWSWYRTSLFQRVAAHPDDNDAQKSVQFYIALSETLAYTCWGKVGCSQRCSYRAARPFRSPHGFATGPRSPWWAGRQNAHAELRCQSLVSLDHIAAVYCDANAPVMVKMALISLVNHVRHGARHQGA